jgi:hypothetical protein
MATVQGIRERIGQPVLDAFRVPPGKQLREIEAGSTLKFFVNVQGKTKLETNLQSASLLPHYNTFEARTMRVVISDLPPEFPDPEDRNAPRTKGKDAEGFQVTDGDGNSLPDPIPDTTNANFPSGVNGSTLTANLNLALERVMELLRKAQESVNKEAIIGADDEDVTLFDGDTEIKDEAVIAAIAAAGDIALTIPDLEVLIRSMEKLAPPLEQIRPNDGAGNIISKLIFNTVTTLFVGEKIMIEMPTWFFPGGAGPYSFSNKTISHGEPSPLATFRFAEPVFIDKQQNFRVEIDIPDSDVHKSIQQIYGPLFIWVVLDGYLTRDVQ